MRALPGGTAITHVPTSNKRWQVLSRGESTHDGWYGRKPWSQPHPTHTFSRCCPESSALGGGSSARRIRLWTDSKQYSYIYIVKSSCWPWYHIYLGYRPGERVTDVYILTNPVPRAIEVSDAASKRYKLSTKCYAERYF